MDQQRSFMIKGRQGRIFWWNSLQMFRLYTPQHIGLMHHRQIILSCTTKDIVE